ncbi:hypothetical protein [Legionella sp. km772]|uniref:hypothetical protein n=1 Tax=Legionella sp. km772 TaxID=2498111 RepID=UPI000F8D9B75|nr:hypothetical protein [Legionella sp. km772]RUR05050.1 hypothetical protein ELY15_14780 [Legionella sp. km772]
MSKWRLSNALSVIFLSSLSAFAEAKLPPISFTALTDPLLKIPKNDTGFISYKIVNTSDKTYHFILQTQAGISQDLTVKNSCSDGLISLEKNESCILSLQIRAQEVITNHNLGPVLCEYDQVHLTQGECFGPSAEEGIRIKALKEGQPSFSIAVQLPQALNSAEGLKERPNHCFSSAASCSLTLFVGSSARGSITITNSARTGTVPELQAYNLPVGVTASPTRCPALNPGASCTMNFTPGLTHAPSPVTVRIANAPTPSSSDATINMRVLGVGDFYDGNKLFQLPFTSLNSSANFYTALPADGYPLTVQGFAASSYCQNGSIVPPTASVLQQLRNVSNCVPASSSTIGGFVCDDSSYYWTSALANAYYDVVKFQDGTVTTFPNDGFAYIRCIKGYVLTRTPTVQ